MVCIYSFPSLEHLKTLFIEYSWEILYTQILSHTVFTNTIFDLNGHKMEFRFSLLYKKVLKFITRWRCRPDFDIEPFDKYKHYLKFEVQDHEISLLNTDGTQLKGILNAYAAYTSNFSLSNSV